jgi:hypothetical protein
MFLLVVIFTTRFAQAKAIDTMLRASFYVALKKAKICIFTLRVKIVNTLKFVSFDLPNAWLAEGMLTQFLSSCKLK